MANSVSSNQLGATAGPVTTAASTSLASSADLQLSSSASSSTTNTPSSGSTSNTSSSAAVPAQSSSNITTAAKPNAQLSTTSSSSSIANPTNVQQTASEASSSSNSGGLLVNNDNKWIFSLDKIKNSPSRKDNISLEEELNERQEAALFISDLGCTLKVNQLCINTAIIYMHRFYMIHSLKKFHRYVRVSLSIYLCIFFCCFLFGRNCRRLAGKTWTLMIDETWLLFSEIDSIFF
jgi:hypothetical protein